MYTEIYYQYIKIYIILFINIQGGSRGALLQKVRLKKSNGKGKRILSGPVYKNFLFKFL